MFLRSILSIAICLVAVHEVFGDQRQAKSSIFQINHKKPIHVVSDKFLSFTVDPTTLLHVADCQLTNATLSLIRGLLPAYLRVAGTDSNRLLFKNLRDGEFSSDSSVSSSKSKNLVLSGNQWNKFYEFVSTTGLNLIACLSGGIFNEQTDRDLSNALEFITFSSKNNFNMNWQLGYELQKVSRDDGEATGLDVAKLRKILEVFPRYQNSLIVGPDVTNFDSREDILFLRNYLLRAQNSLNAFTIHPNFASIPDKDLYNSLSDLFAKMDSYLWLRDGIFKTTSKGVVPKKPIWIAESENKESECQFSDSMSLIKRLGFSAKLGASVYLRKPHLLSIYEPTSEFWAASLFKALVGRSVLDTKLASGNNSSLVVFSHCTQILEKPEESIINPTVAYERGSVTAYGVNTESEPIRLILKTGIKTDETVHMYVLTEDPRNRIGKTLLNRQHLGLSAENDLPMLSPKIRETAESVVVPAHSIFFLVFPNIRCRACMQQLVEDDQDALKTKNKPLIGDVEDSTNISEATANVPEILEEPEDQNAVYVSYPKKSERMLAAHEYVPEITELPEEMEQLGLDSPAIGPKYFTFSDDTWLSSFPEKFKEIEQPSAEEDSQNSQSKKIEKYRVLAQAFVGQRNVTPQPHSEDVENSKENHKEVKNWIKRPMRTPRSVASLPSEINSLYQQTRDSSRYVPYDLPISDDLEEFNNNPSHWHLRNRRDTGEDGSLVPRDSSKVSEAFPVLNNTPAAKEVKLIGSTVDKMNLPSMLPEWIEELDESTIIRQNREIDGKNLAAHLNLASDPKMVAEESNVATSFGPVSPFPRHHMKPTKSNPKSFKAKKMAKSVDVFQNQQSEVNSSEPHLKMSSEPSSSQPGDSREESAADHTVRKDSEIPVESQTTYSPPLDSTSLSYVKDPDTSAKNVTVMASTARNADTPVNHVISPKHATNEPIVSKGVSPSLHSATHKNKARAHSSYPHQNEAPDHPNIHSRTKDLKAKATPSNALDDFIKKLKDDTSKLQSSTDPSQVISLAHARLQELWSIHKARMEERQKKIQQAAANKRQVARNSNQGRNKRETSDSASAMEPKNSLELKDLNDEEAGSVRQVHPQKDHAPTHLHGSTKPPSRPTPIHLHRSTKAFSKTGPTHLHRSTKAPSKTGPTHLHRSTEAPSKTGPTHLHRSTKAPSKTAPTHLHRSTETPSRTTPVPRGEKPARKPFQVPQKNAHDLRHSTLKSLLADKHEAKIQQEAKMHLPEGKLDKHHLQKRDSFDDFFSEVKHVYDDVSSEVHKNIAPMEKWVEERAKDVKNKFNELRMKRDLGAFKEKFRETKEKLRQKIEDVRQHHGIRVRDIGSHHQKSRPAPHFDEKIKERVADLKKKIKQDLERSREHKANGISKHKSEVPSSHIEPDRNRFVRSLLSDNLSEQDNEIIFNEDFHITIDPSNELNDSSADKIVPRIFGNFSDILLPSEKKSTSSDESDCSGKNFISGLWCETKSLFSTLFGFA